jgi:heavy metal sensor kinase
VLLAGFVGSAYAFVAYTVRARTDASLSNALLDLRTALAAEREANASTRSNAIEIMTDMRFRTIALIVLDASANVVASSTAAARPLSGGKDRELLLDPRRLAPSVLLSAQLARTITITLPDAEGGYRVALSPLDRPDGHFVLAAATSLHDDAEMLGNARLAMSIAIPVALLLAWLGGWLLAGRSLAPMVDIGDAAATISATNLGDRVPIANPSDEVGQLAAVINGLLDRLERAFAQQRQFVADASHELRTPVAVVQNEAARALSRAGRSGAEYEDAFTVVQAAARRLQRIVDDLFLLARADAGELPVRRQPLYLEEIVRECVRELRTLAAQRGLALHVVLPNEAPYEGDEALLRRLLINLLDNAVKYSSPGGAVDIRLSRADDTYQLEVENSGPSIPAELQGRIFDRFVRGDSARTRADGNEADALTSGAGLGLSIARWIATAHTGTLALARSDQSGTVFRLSLPIRAA